jgi:hypothetical protein
MADVDEVGTIALTGPKYQRELDFVVQQFHVCGTRHLLAARADRGVCFGDDRSGERCCDRPDAAAAQRQDAGRLFPPRYVSGVPSGPPRSAWPALAPRRRLRIRGWRCRCRRSAPRAGRHRSSAHLRTSQCGSRRVSDQELMDFAAAHVPERAAIVAVEDRLRSEPLEHGRKFPGQIGRVPPCDCVLRDPRGELRSRRCHGRSTPRSTSPRGTMIWRLSALCATVRSAMPPLCIRCSQISTSSAGCAVF